MKIEDLSFNIAGAYINENMPEKIEEFNDYVFLLQHGSKKTQIIGSPERLGPEELLTTFVVGVIVDIVSNILLDIVKSELHRKRKLDVYNVNLVNLNKALFSEEGQKRLALIEERLIEEVEDNQLVTEVSDYLQIYIEKYVARIE